MLTKGNIDFLFPWQRNERLYPNGNMQRIETEYNFLLYVKNLIEVYKSYYNTWPSVQS